MDANKNETGLASGEPAQRGPVQQLLSADVEVRINPGSFDPIDIGHSYEAG